MERRALGATELRVSVLGLGTSEIGFQETDDRTVGTILGTALEGGVNVIDTAAMYREAEATLGRLLVSRRQEVVIVTKCGRHVPPGILTTRAWRRARRRMALRPTPEEWRPRVLARNIEDSLRRLRTDVVDVMLLHACPMPVLRDGDAVQTLHRAQEAGKVRYVGFSGDGPEAAWAVDSGLFDVVELSVNVADQQPLDQVLPAALAAGLGVIAKRPIANGMWRHDSVPSDPDMRAYWERLRILDYPFARHPNAFAVALAFTLRAGVHTAVVGTTNPAHVLANIAAAERRDDYTAAFDAIRTRWRKVAGPDWVGQT